MPVLVRKVARVLLSVWLIVTCIFVLMRMAGDPALEILGPDEFPPDILASFRASWGIDQPLWQQYLTYLSNAVEGDFGRSFLDQRSALTVVMERLPQTLTLMSTSLAIMLLIGIPAGIYAALRHNRAADTAVSAAAIVFYAVPNFVLGVLLILVFAVDLRWLPVGGSGDWRHLILPAVTFGASGAALFARFVRSSMLDALRQPYIVAAKARGLPWRTVVLRHALPNAALPVLTILGLTVGGLVAGSIVVETVFAWPGVGRLTAMAVSFRDLAVIQVIVMLVMIAMVTTNLVVDLLYAWCDPRIRLYGRAGG